MKLIYLFIILGLGSAEAQDKLLDKIAAVINTKVISLSELNRVQETIPARREVSPVIYTKTKYSEKEITDLVIRSFIVRDKINAQGYVINDDAVESRIKMTEERLGLRRADLLQFLKTKNITYEEYFEVIRETMEYNIFASRIIAPLVSVTEQEIKNEYYRRNDDNKALSFKYNLVDFYISEKAVKDKKDERILQVLKDYQLTGKLPSDFAGLETNNLENLNEDGLNKDLAGALKTTAEGSFSKPVNFNGYIHVFYVQKKDLVESQNFAQAKETIQNEIFMEKGQSVVNNWFDREYSNYYIKKFL